MFDTELYDRLVGSGVSAEEAEAIAKSYVPNADVDTERLTKALENLRDTMSQDVAAPEAHLPVDDSLVDDSDVIGAITKGADAILAQGRAHIDQREFAQDRILERQDAMAKSLLALGDAVDRIEGLLNGNSDKVAKSLDAVKTALSEPVPHRSVHSVSDHPGDVSAAPSLSRQDLISKALTEMQATDDYTRRLQLNRAVSLLESGEQVQTVVTNFNLTAQ
mgnify:CR=1 FL=1